MRNSAPKADSIEKFISGQLGNLGKRMNLLRKKKGYKNYEIFAYENDIPRAQYGRYERGQDLKFSSLLKVIKSHNMTLKEFFAEGFD